MHKIFRYAKFSETLKGCPWNFSALWDQKFSTEFSDIRFLCIKFFDTPNFLKHWRDANEIFRHCETKNFRLKNVIPPSMHKIFRYPKISETLKGCPRKFSALWDQKFSTEKRDTPFSSIKLSETKNFLKNSRIPSRKFSALWDIKILTENGNMPPLINNFFSIPENFRKTEGFLYKAFRFGPVRQKVPTNPWYPLLCMKMFDKRIFLKHQSVLHWNISVQWDKNFDGKSWYYAPHTLIQTFSIPEINETLKDPPPPPTEIFGTVRQKIFDRKSWNSPPPLIHKLFRYRKFSETAQKGSPTKFFGTVRQKNFDRKSKIVK